MVSGHLLTRIARCGIALAIAAAISAPFINGLQEKHRGSAKIAPKLRHYLDFGFEDEASALETDDGPAPRQGVSLAGPGTELADNQIEAQIDELVFINDDTLPNVGYVFLPAPTPEEGSAGIIEPLKPGSADELVRPLVAAGPRAVPHLLAHLSDARKTKVAVMHQGHIGGMFWSGEYDQGTRQGVMYIASLDNRNPFGNWSRPLPPKHVITVGDLCFATLGLIVNREFHPVRYQRTACDVINSPTTTPAITAAANKGWSGLTPIRHRLSLINDFRSGRENDAILRLAYYYPVAAEPIAVEQLRRPMYSWNAIDQFVTESLYTTGDPARWDQLSTDFIAKYGPAFRDGLIERLIADCRSQDNGTPPEKQDARPVLAHLFPNIDRKIWPHKTVAIDQSNISDLIKSLTPLKSATVDAEIYRIFQGIGSGRFDAEREDDLAIACMERLIGTGHDDEFISYCARRQPANVRYGEELGKLRQRIQSRGGSRLQ